MDRFNSRQDNQFNKAAFDAGAEARIVHGLNWLDMMRENPYSHGKAAENPWLERSFRAGWADADQELSSKCQNDEFQKVFWTPSALRESKCENHGAGFKEDSNGNRVCLWCGK